MTSRKGNAVYGLTCGNLQKGEVPGFDDVLGQLGEKVGSLDKMERNVKEGTLCPFGAKHGSITNGKQVGRIQLSTPDYC
jgi:hypothetical protein